MTKWLRWCDSASALAELREDRVLPTGAEGQAIERQRVETERQRAETERLRAETEQQRADRLAERLRTMGIDPNEV